DIVFRSPAATEPEQEEVRMTLFIKETQTIINQAIGICGASGILDEMPKQTNNSFYGIEKELGNQLCQPYSLYRLEMGLHIPMLLADRFLQSQQFELALSVCHFVLDPAAPGRKSYLSRIWKLLPFKDIQRMPLEDYLLEAISPKSLNNSDAVKIVTDWRNNAFWPQLVARSRPLAYMKWIVIKYKEILIAYGDFYFRRSTLESIPNAIRMYVLASRMYGPWGQKIPRRHNIWQFAEILHLSCLNYYITPIV
ncbi:hypothetical protein CEP54_016407, partial [Fusarium duplospermum]